MLLNMQFIQALGEIMKESVDERTLEDIVGYYIEKKRLTNKKYLYIPADKYTENFKEAARLCTRHELHPARYVNVIYDNLEKKEFFSPSHLCGAGAVKAIQKVLETGNDYKVEITNATIDYADVWQQQRNLAMIYVKHGESVESVLMDSSLKFFAWYRILSTPEKNMEIVSKYKRIARDELNRNLTEFIKAQGLDLDRIKD